MGMRCSATEAEPLLLATLKGAFTSLPMGFL